MKATEGVEVHGRDGNEEAEACLNVIVHVNALYRRTCGAVIPAKVTEMDEDEAGVEVDVAVFYLSH